MQRTIIALLALILLTTPLSAAPLDLAKVSDQADWVLHLDMERLRQTALGKQILQEIDQRPEVQEKLQVFANIFSFNPVKDVNGVLLYGRGQNPEEAVAVAQGRFNPDILVSMITMNEYYTSSKYGDYTIHHWADRKKVNRPQTPGSEEPQEPEFEIKDQYGAVYGKDTVLLSGSEEILKHALDVMTGRVDNAAGQPDLTEFQQEHQGEFLIVAAKGVSGFRGDDTGILKQTDRFALAVGEDDLNTYVDLTLEALSPDAARQITQMMQGLIAFVSLSASEHVPQASELASAITINSDQSTVRAHFAWDSKKLIDMVRKLIPAAKAVQ